jgi:hypothetical protein
LAKQQEDLSRSLRSRGPPQAPATEEGQDTEIGAQEDVPQDATKDESVAQEDAVLEDPVHAVLNVSGDVAEEPAPEAIETVEETEPHDLPLGPTIADETQPTAPEATALEFQPEAVTPSVEITSEPEPKTLTSEKPCEETTTPATSHTPSRAPSRSHSKSPMRLEESIEAFDALEEALEQVGKAIVFDQSADEDKSPRKATFPRSARTAKKSPLASRVSRESSVASKQALKPSAPRSSIVRSSSVRAPVKERKASAEVADYLASKRRPISMSFPTPPPPPKSTKAPTKATFQLPGEAVAAKLKAQKEERLKREAEEGPKKPRPISMPPPTKSTKPPTKPTFQLPGEAVAAKLKAQKEERLRREAEGEEPAPRQVSIPPRPKSTKPPTVASFQLPGEAIAAKLKAQKEERLKREEDAEFAKKASFKARPAPARKLVATAVRQTSTSKAREGLMSKESQAGVSIAPPPQRTSSLTVGKRSSMILPRAVSNSSATSSHRNSVILNTGPVVKSTVTPEDAVAQKAKGKQVFNRDKMEKENRDRERREKEDAAKKARAEAAERGRIASREWAEKQRKKMVSNAAAMKTEAA